MRMISPSRVLVWLSRRQDRELRLERGGGKICEIGSEKDDGDGL
jgi:hypothetical protein